MLIVRRIFLYGNNWRTRSRRTNANRNFSLSPSKLRPHVLECSIIYKIYRIWNLFGSQRLLRTTSIQANHPTQDVHEESGTGNVNGATLPGWSDSPCIAVKRMARLIVEIRGKETSSLTRTFAIGDTQVLRTTTGEQIATRMLRGPTGRSESKVDDGNGETILRLCSGH